MSKTKFKELSLLELNQQLAEKRAELLTLKLKSASNQLTKKHLLADAKRDIARIHTYLHMKQVANETTD